MILDKYNILFYRTILIIHDFFGQCTDRLSYLTWGANKMLW